MSRSIPAVFVMALLAISVCTPAVSMGAPKEDNERAYVLVEVTGMEVNCSVFYSQQDVNARIEDLKKANYEVAKGNKVLVDEVKKLNGQLAAAKRRLAAAKDDAAKEEAQNTIDDLTSQIAAKKAEAKPLTEWKPAKHFNKRAEADKYVDEVYKQAEAEKERAAKKQAEKDAADKKD